MADRKTKSSHSTHYDIESKEGLLVLHEWTTPAGFCQKYTVDTACLEREKGERECDMEIVGADDLSKAKKEWWSLVVPSLLPLRMWLSMDNPRILDAENDHRHQEEC